MQMWDLIEEVTKGVAGMPHHGRWLRFRWHPRCVTSTELVDAVLVFLDSEGVYKYVARGYVVGLCQRMVEGGAVVRVAGRRPDWTSMIFKEDDEQVWRVVEGWERGGWRRKPPTTGPLHEFTECRRTRRGVLYDDDAMLYVYKETEGCRRPVAGVCTTLFTVTRDGRKITLRHPHSREADISWVAGSDGEAAVWEMKLTSHRGKPPYEPVVNSYEPTEGQQHVVVVGGGYCGVKVAKELQSDFNVTLIDSKDYFENTPSALRAFVDPSYQRYIHRSYATSLPKADVITAKVTEISPSHVELEGRRVPFDFLVLATGSGYRHGLIKSEFTILPSRNCTIHATHRKLEKAKKVLIIGAGLVGVELAAEITYKYPTKHVVVVESGKSVLPEREARLIEKVTKWLAGRGVEILTEKRVTDVSPEGDFILEDVRDGELSTVPSVDIDFACCGVRPNSDFLKKNPVFSPCLDPSGHVKVDSSLRVTPFENIFAGGDLSATPEQKLAQNASAHASCIIANIRALSSGTPLTSYTTTPRNHLLLSLGPYDGIFVPKQGWGMLTGWIAACGKSLVEYQVMRELTP